MRQAQASDSRILYYPQRWPSVPALLSLNLFNFFFKCMSRWQNFVCCIFLKKLIIIHALARSMYIYYQLSCNNNNQNYQMSFLSGRQVSREDVAWEFCDQIKAQFPKQNYTFSNWAHTMSLLIPMNSFFQQTFKWTLSLQNTY